MALHAAGRPLDPRETPAQARLRRWAWLLAVVTIAWNCVEGAATIAAGVVAGSIALVGFGLDSVVEICSALVIVWFLLQETQNREVNLRAEGRAVRLVALAFFAVAGYVGYEAASSLAGAGVEPETSPLGIGFLAFSVVANPSLAWAKWSVATRLGSAALRADAAQTRICALLAGAVLIGLVANETAGWWWMDSAAGLAVAVLALKEGVDAWRDGTGAAPLDR
jgi:divalent metal cation (Fe/Co/Zn/Cd) transporter